ncbi:MAG: NADH-quinone oxidoreductase subunit J [Gemmatimonadales bacterium]
MTGFAFWTFSGVAIAAALLCITRRSPVASALWLVLTLFSLAGLFVILDAHFIAAIQVLVYAGAIMVLFLFVIMLLNLGKETASDLPGLLRHGLTIGLGTILAAELWAVTKIAPSADLTIPADALRNLTKNEGAVSIISGPLFQTYLIPFEITSVLLLAAIVGAVVLAKRRL